MNRQLLPLLGLLSLACASTPPARRAEATEAKPAEEAFGRLSVDEVEALINAGEATVFDNNSEARFAEGHLPGAIWARYDAVTPLLPADKERKLVFYCANERCTACHKAAQAAIAAGHTRVYIMPAGIRGWEAAGKAVQK